MNAYVVSASYSGTGVRFNLFENTASSFTLGTGLFMVSTDNDNFVLDGNAAWTVTINGAAAGLFSALWLKPGAGASKVTIGEDGSLRSAQFAALFAERDAAVTNKGIIHGTNDAVDLLGIGSSSLTNSGVIVGLNNAVLGAAGSDTVTNTGQIFGWIQFGDGTNKLVNSGQITTSSFYGVSYANITFGTGNDSVDNKGVIDGYVDLAGGNDKATNSGKITGADFFGYAFLGGEGGDVIINAKTGSIQYGVSLGGGANSFTNAGFVGNNGLDDSLSGGNSVDTVKNSGTLNGDVHLFDGNDVFTNTGQVNGSIDLGAGNDVFKGGNFNEVVLDGAGGDKFSLGGGNDVFVAFGGESDGINGGEGDSAPDTVDGGAGIDTYDGSNVPLLNTGIYVNLDSVDHSSITKGTATNGNTFYLDNIKGFENATGGSYGDIIFGSSAVNVLKGGGGIDSLFGLAGNDVIEGGDGGDFLVGGIGADLLTGGNDGDVFLYESLKDSGVTKTTRDEITDFVDGLDFIDLSQLDADTRTAQPNDTFSTTLLLGNGTLTTGQAGVLRIYQTATGWMIEAEVTGDGKADFSVAVRDMAHVITWDETNFIL